MFDVSINNKQIKHKMNAIAITNLYWCVFSIIKISLCFSDSKRYILDDTLEL